MKSNDSFLCLLPMKIKIFFDKFKRWVWLKFDESIAGTRIEDLPDKYMYFFGAMNHLSIITVFVTITLIVYYAALNTYYLVPDGHNAAMESCSEVPREMPSGLYVADTNGRYLGESGFLYSEAIYAMRTNNLEISLEAYQSIVSDIFKSAVEKEARESKECDLSRNLITYLAWKVVYPDTKNNLQIFSFASDIGGVFNSKLPGNFLF